MNKSPILILDNNPEDMILIQEAANALNLKRQIYYFTATKDLLGYLHKTKQAPFIIIADINLKKEDAIELKKQITASPTLVYKAIPFIYWSGISVDYLVQHAYDVYSQGFFVKPFAFDELCDTLLLIVQYWEKSKHPMPVN